MISMSYSSNVLFQLILETGKNEDGEDQLLIPAALQVGKTAEDWIEHNDSYKFIFGRQYSSSQCFSLRTFHSIQIMLWEKYGSDSMYFYKDYVHFKHDGFPVWIEAKDKHSTIRCIIAIPRQLLNCYTERRLKFKCGKIADDLFEQVIHKKIRLNNPEDMAITKAVLSLEAMRKGKDVTYDFWDVVNHYNRGYTYIHKIPPYDVDIVTSDAVATLLTIQEIEVILLQL